jgi:hypothetical protein
MGGKVGGKKGAFLKIWVILFDYARLYGDLGYPNIKLECLAF